MKAQFIYWTIESIQKEANKYKSRVEFEKNNIAAYGAAKRRKVVDQVCSHMEILWGSKWNEDSVKMEALKYKTRGEFAKNNASAYHAAHRMGIVDEVCGHMGFPGGNSIAETNLFDLIKSFYPKTQKLKDKKVKIKGKPHIIGFDIDIYIPELRKGIEFDGTYWHSIPGLKRSRDNWPEEDLENYHKIKDNWFSSKGIQLLHIKEEDWNLDKESCIQKCLDFLSKDL